MKLTRLSLAAIVAVGALGSFASATPLEEAIKGVDVTGFARLRYTHDTLSPTGGDDNTTEKIRVSGELNIVSPIADGLAFGTTLATDGYNRPDTSASAPTGDLGIATTTNVLGISDSSGSFYFDKYYFLYTGVQDLAIIAGKYTIPAPWAESGFNGNRGNGVVALYSGVKDWTFAGALYLQTNGFLDTNILTDGGLGKRNLYALGTIGKAGPVDLQFWAASLEKVIDYTAYLNVAFELNGFNARAQVNYLATHEESPLYPDDSGLFYGIEGGYKNDLFFATLGYTQTDKDQPVYALDVDNDGFIKFGQQLYTVTTNTPDVATIFLKGGATLDKFGVEAGYGFAEQDSRDAEASEIYGLVSYQLAPKFGVELYYSYLEGGDDYENSEIQLQLLYSF
ncbi:MAG: major outer membrane protein [Campylobacteraceae bacterium]|jgi:hypothetical protein|nr:major outer membrane protein [Campylobacteraceae bacterium]